MPQSTIHWKQKLWGTAPTRLIHLFNQVYLSSTRVYNDQKLGQSEVRSRLYWVTPISYRRAEFNYQKAVQMKNHWPVFNSSISVLSQLDGDKYKSELTPYSWETNLVCGLLFENFLQATELREYSGAYKMLKIDEIGSILPASAWSTVLKESLVLSVVKEASSELVKRDQSLDVASENSMPVGSTYVSVIGRTFPLELLRMSLHVLLVKPFAISGLI